MPEAARRAGRSPETVRRWIWSGKLPSRKVGNQHLVDSDAVDALTGARTPGEAPVPEVGGEWAEWLRRAHELQQRLRRKGVKLPRAAEMIRESRRGH